MKVGIITMHCVYNYGSALQASALQRYIEKNFDAEVYIIDYLYPNEYHLSIVDPNNTPIQKLKHFLRPLKTRIKGERKDSEVRKEMFSMFWNSYFHLTSKKYISWDEINNDKPQFDIYITGSDQVWNPNTMGNDPAYYCMFAPLSSTKISFGASFSISSLSDKDKNVVRKYLSSYKAIGVREESAKKIVESLTLPSNIEVINTCDPTLLLDSSEYHKLAEKSSLYIDGEYILVYYLQYAYNPNPAMDKVITKAEEKFKLPLIFIGEHTYTYKGKHRYINNIGPCEFIWLFEHAKYVVTSSFHGTAISIIYNKPFTTILPSLSCSKDSRTKDLLNNTGLLNNGIPADYDTISLNIEGVYNENTKKKIKDFINVSKNFLMRSINIGIK